MRTLDIVAAALIAIASLSAIAYMDPVPYRVASMTYAREAGLRQLLLKVAERQGVKWFRTGSEQQICLGVASFSNSSVAVTAVVDGRSCRAAPPPGFISANLTLPLEGRPVTLQAWSSEGP
jgi:hypothetical protein